MVKFLFLFLHIVFGVAGTLFSGIALHFSYVKDLKKLTRFATIEFVCSLLAAVSAGIYYIAFYQEDKPQIIAGKFPLAHSLFMEVKEHSFIIFFLLSLYFQCRIWFTNIDNDTFLKESKMVFICIIILGLFMSAAGIMVNIGFRVNQ